MASIALELHSVSKRFAGVAALTNVDLQMPDGQLRAIIGPNGAGKSTLFGVVSGVHPPTDGKVRFYGDDITGMAASSVVRLGMGRAFQVARLFPHMSVYENVLAATHARRRSAWQFFRTVGSDRRAAAETDTLLEEVGIAGEAARMAGVLSQGDKKLLELTMALALEPRLLLLDEPTAGMSPAETEKTVGILRALHERRSISILLTEHDMGVVFALAEEVTVLHYGQVVTSGSPDEVRSDPQVVEIYLGEPL